jgi:type III secretion system low calcium response chaperone LcrH/SycD
MEEAEAAPVARGAAQEVIDLLVSGATLADAFGRAKHPEEDVLYIAYTLFTQAKYETAMRMFGYLLSMSPLDRRYYSGFADCMRKLHRYAEALKYYGFSSALDLTDPQPVMHSAECFMAMGDTAKAQAAIGYGLEQAQTHERHRRYVERLEALQALIEDAGKAEGTAPATSSDSPPRTSS